MRKSGILLPITSLPGQYGIGTFGQEAYEFVDRLHEAGQGYWQILPLEPTGYGDSPYQSFSTFAGNPYLIDPKMLMEDGLIREEELAGIDFGPAEEWIDYEKIYHSRTPILKMAYGRFDAEQYDDYDDFQRENAFWLEDYALYMAIKNASGGAAFIDWEDGLRLRREEALDRARVQYAGEIDYIRFQQYYFMRQWKALKAYANENGVEIIGDIPIYVAFDSADTWSNPNLFQFDAEGMPIAVAGCPPDAFSESGQFWGNPLYQWTYHEATGYAWWIERIRHCRELYDVIRVDHFRAFDSYYAIPFGDADARNGKWEAGPGMRLFDALKNAFGDLRIIAEDLGYLTPSVRALVKETGYPGMKVLQFAFNHNDPSDYLPHNDHHNSVVYTGTHDNNTLIGWLKELSLEDYAYTKEYMHLETDDPVMLAEGVIRLAMHSVADTCIIPMQEFLQLDGFARINQPATFGLNWKWRMKDDAFPEELAKKIHRMTWLYGRL